MRDESVGDGGVCFNDGVNGRGANTVNERQDFKSPSLLTEAYGEFGSPRSNLSVSAASSSLNRPKRPKNFNGHL
jgi:hypothetical protein